jgi:hypothetical protein
MVSCYVEIHCILLTYPKDKAVASHNSGTGTLPSASAHDIAAYRSWAKSNEISDHRFLDHAGDLIALSPHCTKKSPSPPTDITLNSAITTHDCQPKAENIVPQKFLHLIGSYAFGIVFSLLIAPATGQPWWVVGLAMLLAWGR